MLTSARRRHFGHHAAFLLVAQSRRAKDDDNPACRLPALPGRGFLHFSDGFDGYPQCIWGMGKIDDGSKGLAKVNPLHPSRNAGKAAIPCAAVSGFKPSPRTGHCQRCQAVGDVKRPNQWAGDRNGKPAPTALKWRPCGEYSMASARTSAEPPSP